MDALSAITNNSGTNISTANAVSSSGAATADYDAFLQLLVAQLKNQDPTEPVDNAQLMAQLASFSSVEQQVQMNQRLDQLISSNVLGDATNLIGKNVSTSDGEISGIVKSVVLADDGIFAELEDGRKVPMVSGVIISEASSAPSQVSSNNSAPESSGPPPQNNPDPEVSALY
jgi:flagellar basal-body rod modification protein FlgD